MERPFAYYLLLVAGVILMAAGAAVLLLGILSGTGAPPGWVFVVIGGATLYGGIVLVGFAANLALLVEIRESQRRER